MPRVHYTHMLGRNDEPYVPEDTSSFIRRLVTSRSDRSGINYSDYDLLNRGDSVVNRHRGHDSLPETYGSFKYSHLPLPPVYSSRPIKFESCRNCSTAYEYEISPGKRVTVIIGSPVRCPYKALSFVWGPVKRTESICTKCRKESRILVSSPNKLHALMQVAGTEHPVWLDFLSIDQNSHQDIKNQMALMGQTYYRATYVSVLFPQEDEKLYRLLVSLLFCAHVFLSHFENFRLNRDRTLVLGLSLGDFCRAFFKNMGEFERSLPSWTYWSRAWTFQEWTLANDIEVAWEGDKNSPSLKNVKSTIFRAAVMVANYKLQNGQYALIQPGFSRGEIVRRFDGVRRLFPYEDYLLTYEEVNPTQAAYQTILPCRFGTEQLLGIRLQRRRRRLYSDLPHFVPVELDLERLTAIEIDPNIIHSDDARAESASRICGWDILSCQRGQGSMMRPFLQQLTMPRDTTDSISIARISRAWTDLPRNEVEATAVGPFRARLATMLAAFGTHRREARFEADLIACWASMCGLQYDYHKDDTFAVALQKVVKYLRSRGVKVYNFLVNTVGTSAEVDCYFLQYSAPHPQCNANNGQYLPGTPIFNGRADTALHLYYSLSQPVNRTPLRGSGVLLKKLSKDSARVLSITDCTDTDEVLYSLYHAISGRLPNLESMDIFVDMDVRKDKIQDLFLSDVLMTLDNVLRDIPRARLEQWRLVLVAIHLSGNFPHPSAGQHGTWAICREDAPFKDLFAARESLNGTFVLAARIEHGSDLARVQVFGYLVTTTQSSGSYLFESDEEGYVSIVADSVWRSDMLHVGYNSPTAKMQGKVVLEEDSVMAY